MAMSPRSPIAVCCLLATLLPAAGVHADAAAEQKPPSGTLAVYPANVHLSSARDRQSLVVQLIEADGLTRDVTGQCGFAVEHVDKARLQGATVHPLADGDTTLTVSLGENKVGVPVHVEKAGENPDLSFRLDVLPVFMRNGCNAGACHGAARGKDGFRLSLFGFDPASDYQRLTRELPGRRINLALPTESLLLTKATNSAPHGGGAKFTKESESYAILHRWLTAGAKDDPGAVPACVGVELYPPDAVLDGPGATQQLTVRAKFADGTDRDVTSMAVFLSNNDNSAKVSPDGLVPV